MPWVRQEAIIRRKDYRNRQVALVFSRAGSVPDVALLVTRWLTHFTREIAWKYVELGQGVCSNSRSSAPEKVHAKCTLWLVS